ncbi:xylan 1,4-beta-xylosidase [Clostridium sp. 'deep sea']|uniref:DUF6440 family protein n=1 Tax=Clostridium sp. 'deep sea' TaxID=2779445 RepID=UPI0018969F0A|nr:DUF6440 family protein [Clostridium sp. 'deep sea']QOR35546.1 xylan 1,4-beta-xylosidase [Clostridium sp. 'deep sea']
MGKTKHKRFEIVHQQGSLSQFLIIVDKETGVNYFQGISGYAGGLTPLLDRNGNIVITPITKEY